MIKNRCVIPRLYKEYRSRYNLRIMLRELKHESRKEGELSSSMLSEQVTFLMNYFDRVLGIAEVRAAQSVVTEAEDAFMKSRRNVQESRTALGQLQSQLRELRIKLDRIPREDERYLELATEEHRVLIDEKKHKTDLEAFVSLERDNFATLSGALRSAHEKERSRAERTKYWSIIGSACGAVLGILGSTILNMKRMKEIKLTVEENNQAFIAKTFGEFKTRSDQVTSLGSHGNDTVSSEQKRNDDAMMTSLLENKRLLTGIDKKVDRFLETELHSLIQQLRSEVSLSEGHRSKLTTGIEAKTDLLSVDTGIVFLVAGLSCSLLYFLTR